MQYEIIATLGPCSRTPAIWREMIAAGATAFRLNTSHLTLEGLAEWLRLILDFRSQSGLAIPLVLDLQGSKWRLGEFSAFELSPGETIELVFGKRVSAARQLPVPHPDFFRAVQFSNGEIILNDGKNRLQVLAMSPERLTARVVFGGMISAHKGITFGETQFRVESISEKDSQILAMAQPEKAIRFAVSYVRDASEMERYCLRLGNKVDLIAKLERAPAMADASGIARHCGELWVCRGDLGAELGLRAMAEAVAAFSAQIAGLSVPVLMAGQVLEHMTSHPVPTRSEVCHLLDVLRQGYGGFVLSDEAAVGQSPVESCRAAALFRSE